MYEVLEGVTGRGDILHLFYGWTLVRPYPCISVDDKRGRVGEGKGKVSGIWEKVECVYIDGLTITNTGLRKVNTEVNDLYTFLT